MGQLLFLTLLLAGAFPLSADWVAVGPAPAVEGQDEGITSPEGNNPVAGAINAMAPSATDANLVYVASVNGGVWKTTNAKAASPNWTPLTDQALPSLSLASIAISPLDPKVIFAGAGRTSSLSGNGGKLFGIAKSSDSGATWTVVSTNLVDQNIRSIAPSKTLENGNQVVLAGASGGIFRSNDGGNTYTLVTNGVVADVVADLVSDPGAAARFYAAIAGKIYRSDDNGATWAVVTGNGFAAVATSRVLLSVHSSPGNSVVYAAVIDGGALANVYRSIDQGANWTALGVPNPPLFPGKQGDNQGAIVADKTDPTTVWVSGDRQPDGTELGGMNQFPNPNGANNYSANIFRNVGGNWQLMVLNGANGTSPHADSRAMVFDADGNLLHSCDGGIFKLNDPNTAGRKWSSLNGDIRVAETHSTGYDSVSKNFISGAQDNGVSFQRVAGNLAWLQVAQGDGGRVAPDLDQTAHAGTSVRYYCTQNFGGFSRQTYDANGLAVGNPTAAGLMITAGGGAGMTLKQFDKTVQFYQPYVLNQVDSRRILIGTTNIYESLDMGDTLNNLGAAGAAVGDDTNTGSSPLTYGSRLNGAAVPDVFYVGAGNKIVHRVTAGGPLTTLTYPGDIVRGIVMDPQNYKRVFVLDSMNKIYGSADEGATWTDLTGNIATLTDSVRSIELFNPDASFQKAILYVGGGGGVWQLANPTAAGNWAVVSPGMPKVLVYDVHYDYASNVLTAGTLGRGAFTIGSGTPGSVANISTRLPIGTGDNLLITGFIVTGPAGSTKKVLVRGIGPSTNVPGLLADPTLELHDATGALLARNDNWKTTQISGVITGDQVADIQATGAAPTNDAEAALIATLAPGNYTAQVRGANNTTGIGVAEAYDLSLTSAAKLANVSTRGFVQTGDNIMIGGFIVLNNSVKVVVRAIGPSLTAAGVTGALADPTLELRGANGAIIVANDDWKVRTDGSSQQAEIVATGVPPSNDLESALVATLQPGNYTAQIRGKNSTTGIGVVELYVLP